MKVIPKRINNFVVTPNEKSIILTINESLKVEYLFTDNSNNEILQDLVEAKAYATALLYLNENYRLVTDNKLFTENKVEDYYKDCNNLLKENVEVVEEKGIPLVSINGYNIYESDIGILRGNGKKKLKESFNEENAYYSYWDNKIDELLKTNPTDKQLSDLIDEMSFDDNITHQQYNELANKINQYMTDTNSANDLFPAIKNQVTQYKEEGKDKYFIIDYINGQVRQFSIDKKEAEELKGLLNEDGEGTQVGDIAPKVDQDMNGKSKKKEKKYYDILLSGIDESMDTVLNKGFMKNINGQYERDGYILIKENDKFIAVRKDKVINFKK